MSEAETHLRVALNALSFQRVDAAWGYGRPETAPSLEEVVEYLCGSAARPTSENLCRRYSELTHEAATLPVVPADDTILEKLVEPLRNAIASYMLGNYYGTIALSGMVCEMLAIFVFEIHQFEITGRPFDAARQRKILGRTFEGLGQDGRVKVLSGFGVIPDEMVAKFDLVRDRRKHHLHLLSQDTGQLQDDAVACYRATVDLVAEVLQVDFDNGKIGLRPQIARYWLSSRKTGLPTPKK